MDAMSMSRSWLRRIAPFGLVLALVLGYLGVQQQVTQPAKAATNQFHGVNWANPNDNFITGNLVPVGLSASDSYSTTYTKATAILKGFQSLGANTVRLPFNAATTSGSWWGSYTAAWDAASALGMNVVVAPWLQNGTVSDTTSFYQMWDTVINKYGSNSNFYFDIMNEPWAYSATNLTNFEAAWLARYPNLPRGRVIVPGLYSDQNLCAVGADSRLNGTLLSIHIYGMFGDSHTTEAAWVTDFENNLCGYASRAVLTEFGVPMNTGANYDGPRDGNNDVSYLYGITDTVRSLSMGSILWTGVKQATQTVGPGPCENASCAITSLNGSGTNLSLSITNQSGLDRLQYGWVGGTTPTPTPTSGSGGGSSYEAESSANTLGGRAVVVACSTCSGGEKVGNTGLGGTLQFNNVQASSAGTYPITISYIDGDAGRTAQMSVNGAAATTVTFHGTNDANWNFVQSLTVSVSLNAGNNTILFSNPSASAPDFDRITVASTSNGSTPTPTPTNTPTPTPLTPTPTPTNTPTPTATTTTGSSCKISYVIQNQWPGGFTNSTTITNTGSSAISSWTLKFTFPASQQVTEGWDGTFSQQGSQVTVTNISYNGSIASGGSTALGFNGSWTGSNPNPTSFTLNGATCSTS